MLGIRRFVKMPEHELIERIGDRPQNLAIWQDVRTRKAVPSGWVIDASLLTPEEMREFIVLDNVGYGVHDYEALANEYDKEELDEWGLFVPGFDEDEKEKGNNTQGHRVIVTFESEQEAEKAAEEIEQIICTRYPSARIEAKGLQRFEM